MPQESFKSKKGVSTPGWRRAILLLLCLAAGVFGWRCFSPDEAKVIRRLLGEMARLGSFEGQFHPFARMAWAKEAARYFASEVSIVLLTQEGERQILLGQKELIEKAILFRTSLEQFALALSDPEVNVDQDRAFVMVKARGIGREPGRSDYFKEEHKLALHLKKIEGRWQITRAQNAEPYQGEMP